MKNEEKKHLKTGAKKSQIHKNKISIGLKKYWSRNKKKPNVCNVCGIIISVESNTCRKHRIFTEKHRMKLSIAGYGKKQSLKTREKLKKIRKGKTHWNKGKKTARGEEANNWKGGITKISELERKHIEIKLWRISVFERDLYSCQDCGKIGGKLNAHHIKPFSKFRELRSSIENGITLCEKCHRKRHRSI